MHPPLASPESPHCLPCLSSPLVFDLSLKVGVSGEKDTDGWHILHVYGSPNTDDLSSDGTIMKARDGSHNAQLGGRRLL